MPGAMTADDGEGTVVIFGPDGRELATESTFDLEDGVRVEGRSARSDVTIELALP